MQSKKFILSMVMWFNKWLFILLLPAEVAMGGALKIKKPESTLSVFNDLNHPLHVSVTEINHNAADKTLEISCKLFTDDFEKVLVQNYKTKVDLINPPDRPAMDKIVNDFIQTHLAIKADGKPLTFTYLGYERDKDVIYSYFQAENVPSVKMLQISNHILHELFTDQINLMHVTVGGKRKSIKMDYPDRETEMNFL